MFEVRSILVPTDFSSHAEAALEHAISVAQRYRASVTVLHVDEFSVSPLGACARDSAAIIAYQREKEAFLREEFARLEERYRASGVPLHARIIRGRSYKVIVEEREQARYDLVVIATRGLTGLSSHLIGSTAERVVRLSRQPVLSIPHLPRPGRVASVLCPTDLSPAANSALTYALAIARQNGAKLYVQHISELERPEPEAQLRGKLPDLRQLDPASSDVQVEYIFDRDVEPSNSIIRFAEDRDVGLIVMSTHGRKGIRRVYIGNTTAEVVRQSIRPVLTVSHPLHKQMFARPVTRDAEEPIPRAVPERREGA